MTAVLVTLAEFDTWLGGAVTAENTLRQAILDQVEATFLRECGRELVPFADTQAARAETRDGTGTAFLFLDYPVTTLTSVTLGYDPLTPDETVDITQVVRGAGRRRLVRIDGGAFGGFGAPRYVKVVYDAGADLPTDVKAAILRMAATMYRRRGSEEVKSETMGPYSVTFANVDQVAAADPVWAAAVAGHTRSV